MIRRLLPLTLAGVLLACGGGTDEPDASPTDTTAAAAADESTEAPTTEAPAADEPSTDGAVVADVPSALQFSAPLLGGGDIEMATLAGRPVLLWFWAPW